MSEVKDLSTTDASNTGTAANAGFPENMKPSDVNNAARALEGMIARSRTESHLCYRAERPLPATPRPARLP